MIRYFFEKNNFLHKNSLLIRASYSKIRLYILCPKQIKVFLYIDFPPFFHMFESCSRAYGFFASYTSAF